MQQTTTNQKEISIKLTTNEIQTVLNCLSELPHKIVRELIPKIVNQANEQLDVQKASM